MFLGLDVVVPLMSAEALAVPKAARLYFSLLAYLLDVWPQKTADLPGGHPEGPPPPQPRPATLPRTYPSTLVAGCSSPALPRHGL